MSFDPSLQKKAAFDDFVKKLEIRGFLVSPTQSKKTLGLPPKATILTTALVVKNVYSFLVIILHGREVLTDSKIFCHIKFSR